LSLFASVCGRAGAQTDAGLTKIQARRLNAAPRKYGKEGRC
jgi:hypothetical protein